MGVSVRQVRVSVNGHVLFAPRGFGASYKRAAADPCEPDVLRDILELVGWTAEPEQIAKWPLARQVEALVHAANVSARASDNPVQRHPEPSWFPEPWKGKGGRGEGIFEGPAPTPLPDPT